MKSFRKELPLLIFGAALCSCTVNFQQGSDLVGYAGGIPNYSISGYTSWGEMQKSDAEGYAVEVMKGLCATKPDLVGVQTWDASRMGHHQLAWHATFRCKKIRGEI